MSLEAIKYKTIIFTSMIIDVLQLTFWEPPFSQPALHCLTYDSIDLQFAIYTSHCGLHRG